MTDAGAESGDKAEQAEKVEKAEDAGTVRPRRRRGIVAGLLVLAAVCGLIGIFAVWVNRQALNPENGTEVSAKLLEDPEIQRALSVYLVDQLFANVDVRAQLAAALPPRLQPLAGPAAGALREFASREAPRLLASPQIQKLWRVANLRARRQLLQVVNGGSRNLSTTNGEVVLDLTALVTALAQRVGIGNQAAAVQAKLSLPPDAGKIVLMKSSQLDAAQKGAKLVRHLAFWLTILTFGLLIAAVALADGWRRVALRTSGWILISLAILVLLVRRVAGNQVVDALVPDSSIRAAAHNAWDIATQTLKDIGVAILAYGIVIVIAAWLAGPTRPATGIRRALAPTVLHNRAYVWAAAAFAYLLLLLWGPVHALEQPVGIIATGVALAVGIEFWCRQIAAEFPDAERGETTARIRAWASGVYERRTAGKTS